MLNRVAGEIFLSLLERISKEFDQVFIDSQGFVRRFNKKTGEVGMRTGLDISALAGVDVLKTDTRGVFPRGLEPEIKSLPFDSPYPDSLVPCS